MGLFKKKSKKEEDNATDTYTKNQQPQPPPEQSQFVDPTSNIEPQNPISKRGKKIIDSTNQGHFQPSDVFDASHKPDPTTGGYQNTRSTFVPTAKESAFAGPPRYDWVDVESSAAIKIQSIFRRNRTLTQLEQEGKSTACMRNRARRMQAKKGGLFGNMPGEDVPFAMRLCGMGMLFGDATGGDDEALNSTKEVQEKRFQEKEKAETKRRKFRMRRKSAEKVEEAIEVVDDIALMDEDDDDNCDNGDDGDGDGDKEEGVGAQEQQEQKGKKKRFGLFKKK